MMPPFPGMEPFVEENPLFHEMHIQFLSEAQRLLQSQVRPKYLAKLERHLSEGSVWDNVPGLIPLEGREPDVTVSAQPGAGPEAESTALLATPMAEATEELDADELQLRKQRRIVIYVNARPRLAVTSIELLSPSNKQEGSVGRTRYLEKRASALHGGLHWVEVDLLRGGTRPPLAVAPEQPVTYLAYVAQATPTGRRHLVYGWGLRDPLPSLAIPLLGNDQAILDLGACFRAAYDAIAADDEADYAHDPPKPPLSPEDVAWVDAVLRQHGLRT